MGNYSQDPQTALQNALTKGYTRVRFQQGKPVLDREFNLAADLCGPERLAQTYIGNGTPSGSNGFAISALNVAGNEFTIAAGSALVNGQEVVLAANTTYRTQPIQTDVANLPAGASNVYLHVTLAEINSQQDPDLGNANDVKAETAIREKLNWEVVVSVAAQATPDYYLLATINTATATINDQRRLGLTAAALRDEVTAARGSAADLGTRLGVSLDPGGALLANSVSTNQLANGCVVPAKIAAAAITAPALAAAAITEPAFAAGAVSNRALANGAVTIAKMAQTVVFNGQVSVPAAPAAGQLGTATVNIIQVDTPVFLLISMHFDGPRPVLAATALLNQSFQWRCQSTLVKPAGTTTISHVYGVLIENPSTTAISVTCKAYMIGEA